MSTQHEDPYIVSMDGQGIPLMRCGSCGAEWQEEGE